MAENHPQTNLQYAANHPLTVVVSQVLNICLAQASSLDPYCVDDTGVFVLEGA